MLANISIFKVDRLSAGSKKSESSPKWSENTNNIFFLAKLIGLFSDMVLI
jgi:hypothetical protein